MKAIALGINGFGYSVLADCRAPFINSLFMSFPRGVVENRERLEPGEAWSAIAGKLEGRAILANIPTSDPTSGVVSLPRGILDVRAEMEALLRAFSGMGEGIMVASVNSYENVMRSDWGSRCAAASTIDSYLRKFYEASDSFMFFSPFGEIIEGGRDVYGIYISTVPRPREDDTIKLEELPDLMLMLLEGP